MKNEFRVLAAALCLLLIGSIAAVSARKEFAASILADGPRVKVKLFGTVARSEKDLAVEEAGAVDSGEVLTWVITSQNDGGAPARQYKVVGQIPPGTTLIEDSSRGENQPAVAYSVDGGKNFSPRPTVEEKQADGTVKTVPAPTSRYTQIRYEWERPLDPGAAVSASYKVRVK